MHLIDKTQIVPITIEEAWAFFSSPENLKTITPDHMGFEILEGTDKPMYPGQIIRYNVRPLLGITLKWTTEITQVREKEFFIDEQRFGPYKFWHHQHFFKPHPKGVEVQDIVHYLIPFGIFGKIANTLLVKKQLAGIFDYRKKKLKEMFG
ncbi:MAG: SRPBCC family protein [Cyclobacteriaceae bacterium]